MSETSTSRFADSTGQQVEFTTLFAQAGSVEFVGVESLTLAANNLEVEINRASSGEVLDFSETSLTLATGPGESLDITTDGALGSLTRAKGSVDINVADFFSLVASGTAALVGINGLTLSGSVGVRVNRLAETIIVGVSGVTALGTRPRATRNASRQWIRRTLGNHFAIGQVRRRALITELAAPL